LGSGPSKLRLSQIKLDSVVKVLKVFYLISKRCSQFDFYSNKTVCFTLLLVVNN